MAFLSKEESIAREEPAPAVVARTEEALEQTISLLVAQAVGTSVSQDVPLMEAGVDSLAASEVVSSIGTELEVELPATLLFDHPSITAIRHHIE